MWHGPNNISNFIHSSTIKFHTYKHSLPTIFEKLVKLLVNYLHVGCLWHNLQALNIRLQSGASLFNSRTFVWRSHMHTMSGMAQRNSPVNITVCNILTVCYRLAHSTWSMWIKQKIMKERTYITLPWGFHINSFVSSQAREMKAKKSKAAKQDIRCQLDKFSSDDIFKDASAWEKREYIKVLYSFPTLTLVSLNESHFQLYVARKKEKTWKEQKIAKG